MYLSMAMHDALTANTGLKQARTTMVINNQIFRTDPKLRITDVILDSRCLFLSHLEIIYWHCLII